MQKLPAEGKSQKLSPHPAPPKWPRQGPTATLATLMAPPSTAPPSPNKASSPLSMPSRPETYKAIGLLTPEPLEPCAPTAIGSTRSKRSSPPHTSSSVTTAPFLPPDRGTSTSTSQLKENGIAQSSKTFYMSQSSMGTYCQFTNSPNVEHDCFLSTQLAKSSGGQMMFLLRVKPMEAYTP